MADMLGEQWEKHAGASSHRQQNWIVMLFLLYVPSGKTPSLVIAGSCLDCSTSLSNGKWTTTSIAIAARRPGNIIDCS